MKSTQLATRDARSKLEARHEPYWYQIVPGSQLGYRKSTRGAAWYLRRHIGGKYYKRKIGNADDDLTANDQTVLSFRQACRAAGNVPDSELVTAATRRQRRAKSSTIVRKGRNTYTVADACADYLEWFARERKSIAQTSQVVDKHILPHLGPLPVAALSFDTIRDWRDAIAESPRTLRGGKIDKNDDPETWDAETRRKRRATANRILTTLKAALNHAWSENRIPGVDPSPWKKLKPYKGADAPRVAHLDILQARKLLEHAPTEDFRNLTQAALLTGCRYGELCALVASDFSSTGLLIRDSKSGKPRNISLTTEGREFFRRLTENKEHHEPILTKEGRPWNRSEQSRPMRKACAAAGIPPVGFHILRHTFATLLLRPNGDSPGMTIRQVAEALGNTVKVCERHYGHIIQDDLQKQLEKHLPSFGASAK